MDLRVGIKGLGFVILEYSYIEDCILEFMTLVEITSFQVFID